MFLRAITFGLISAHGLASAAAGQDACAIQVGDKITLTDLTSVLEGTRRTAITKDPFETSAEFEARRLASAESAGFKTVILASNVDHENAIYDADKSAWFLTKYFPSNPVFEFADKALEDHGLIGHRDSERVETVILRSVDNIIGDYSASNAMGATLKVEKWLHERVAISEIAPTKRSGYKYGPEIFAFPDEVEVNNVLGSGTKLEPALRIDMPRDQAREISGRIGFAIVADLVDPVRIEGSFYIEPKFDRPADRTVKTTVLVADILCGVAYSPDFSVLAIVKTRAPY